MVGFTKGLWFVVMLKKRKEREEKLTSALLGPARRKQLGKMARISMLWEGALSYWQCCVVFPVQGNGLEEGGWGGGGGRGGGGVIYDVCPALIQIWALELNLGGRRGCVSLSRHNRDFNLYFHMIKRSTLSFRAKLLFLIKGRAKAVCAAVIAG